ncbi:hypothetical protein ER308_09325 [Egibacter rhizosphaerae]|uniref:Uncharacterized protein n=1 Tax=Egibacter rhizosphaerae TaxID=1670831 RepID=A0A411YEV0_9ACTN|nr:hypothetical protein [Egibacter rhizosphaerae]QBI19730.1 hypothetical protein ER308_09325 [Egibacter rhizosphaerae]
MHGRTLLRLGTAILAVVVALSLRAPAESVVAEAALVVWVLAIWVWLATSPEPHRPLGGAVSPVRRTLRAMALGGALTAFGVAAVAGEFPLVFGGLLFALLPLARAVVARTLARWEREASEV